MAKVLRKLILSRECEQIRQTGDWQPYPTKLRRMFGIEQTVLEQTDIFCTETGWAHGLSIVVTRKAARQFQKNHTKRCNDLCSMPGGSAKSAFFSSC
jgi:hypothetical protein